METLTDLTTFTVVVVPATVHPTMAAVPTTTAALEMEGMLVSATAPTPTMVGTVLHLTAVDMAALPTEVAVTEVAVTEVAVTEVVVTDEATTERRSIKK